MRLTLLALAAVLPTFGAAHANDFGSLMQFPSFDGLSARQPQATPYTAMPGGVPDFSSQASLGASPGRMRFLFWEAPVRSTTRSAPRSFGLTSSDTLTGSAAHLGAKPLIPCVDSMPRTD